MGVVRYKVYIPILLHARFPIRCKSQYLAGAKLVNAFNQALGNWCCKKGEEPLSRLPVQGDIDFRQLKNCLEFRSEYQPSMNVRIVQWLDAQPVARQKESPAPAIP